MANVGSLVNTLDQDGYLRFNRRKMDLENEIKRLQQAISFVEFNTECKELLMDYVMDSRKEINFLDQVMKEYLSRS